MDPIVKTIFKIGFSLFYYRKNNTNPFVKICYNKAVLFVLMEGNPDGNGSRKGTN